jgi:nucleoside-diphosphate-sugar epimerase
MADRPLIAVVGADGFVGAGFAAGLGARRVVYGPPRGDDVHISAAEPLLREADVIVNAGGFRVRRGLTYADYQRCHQGSTSRFVPWIRRGALLLHMSSAHVLGTARGRALGNHSPPDPRSYPSAAYAQAKLEQDEYLQREAAQREFRAIFLRPTILYAHPGDASLPDHLCQWARRGTMLRLYPRDARHHLCHRALLVEIARRAIAAADRIPTSSCLVVADPDTITSRELDALIEHYLPRRPRSLPIPAPLLSALLARTFHARRAGLDLKTWGEIFGVFHLDTRYDPSETFRLLAIDAERYSRARMLEPFVRQAVRGPEAVR